MKVAFFIVRLVAALVAASFLVCVGIVVSCMALGLAPLVAALALLVWLLVLLPVYFVYAALTNQREVFASFLKETEKHLKAIPRDALGSVRDYFGCYRDLWKWVVEVLN